MKPAVLRGVPPALPPGRLGDPGLFAPGSIVRRVNGEAILLLAAPRILLMQIAHPAVAAGVARHSDFPRDAWPRLARTLDVMFRLTFGDSEQAAEAAAGMAVVHARVSGTGYRALDEDLLLWVWATLVDGALEGHRRFVGGLDAADEDAYVREMGAIAVASGVREGRAPATRGSFDRYLARMLPALEVGADARGLAPPILSPPLPLPFAGVRVGQRLLTVGLLPDDLRRAYGLRWSAAHAALFEASCRAVRTAVRATPARLRRAPQAIAAGRRMGGTNRSEQRRTTTPGPSSRKRNDSGRSWRA